MDKQLIFDFVFLALIIIFAVGVCVAWLKRRHVLSAMCGVATIACVAAMVAGPFLVGPRNPGQQAQENNKQAALPQASPSVSPLQRPPSDITLASLERLRPAEVQTAGYQAADACRECHQENHDSWHASYHRTMTQVATPEAIIGDFNDAKVTARGREYLLQRVGDTHWCQMNNPDLPPAPSTRMNVPIVMTTGTHHMQVYWFPGGKGRNLALLPIVYLRETQQWIPRVSAFLKPSNTKISSENGRWNMVCSNCHTTHRRERRVKRDTWDTQVSELGISCEACHGPGQQHIAFHRSTKATGDDPIVNPAHLKTKAASQVCGQCHSIHTNKERLSTLYADGHGYRPGMDLNKTHNIWGPETTQMVKDYMSDKLVDVSESDKLRGMFWKDGTVRVSGREFNGMIESSCHKNGELSCLSCHSMHQDMFDSRDLKAWANDQLAPVALSDKGCTQCHEGNKYGESHTHHAAGSSGSKCYNCHMPHTSYGLLKAIRSHTIFSPNIEKDLKAERPNACNLCHLDKTLQWSAETMHQWYGDDVPELTEEQKTVAASLLWLLKGDAGERALASWAMGWDEAQQASGSDWIAPLLSPLLDDPYDAIRFVTRRSMRSLPGFSDLEFNAMWSPNQRAAVIGSVRTIWQQQTAETRRAEPQLLIEKSGVQIDRLDGLLRQRNDRLVNLIE